VNFYTWNMCRQKTCNLICSFFTSLDNV
jgi:hypothetical protein